MPGMPGFCLALKPAEAGFNRAMPTLAFSHGENAERATGDWFPIAECDVNAFLPSPVRQTVLVLLRSYGTTACFSLHSNAGHAWFLFGSETG
jgi:hypothetical protein